MKPRILVVHYSRTGRTRLVAEELARALHADSEEIRDVVEREGAIGYLRSALEALSGVSCEIRVPVLDPSRYDVVVVGTPVWSASISTPVRTYLWLVRDRLPRVAFYVTHGGSGSARALRQLRSLTRKPPVATLVLREREVVAATHHAKVARLARAIANTAALHRPARGVRRLRAAS
jgi:menaquinone-dependent protoporphyrinogen IX oxidase